MARGCCCGAALIEPGDAFLEGALPREVVARVNAWLDGHRTVLSIAPKEACHG